MAHERFDFAAFIRSVTGSKRPSRRDLLRGLAGAGLGVAARPLQVGMAGKKRKKKPKRPKPNAFGCLNVGQSCGGKDERCCSGICQGRKPKKGKRDKSRCVGHNEGLCTRERNLCAVGAVDQARCNAAIPEAVCFVTTGSGVFCGDSANFKEASNCRLCSRDTDCTAAGFPQGSACVSLAGPGAFCGGSCAVESGGRACMPPGI